MYQLIKSLLFKLPPETAHYVTLSLLKIAHCLTLTRFIKQPSDHPIQLMGLTFPNRVGLAAGLDKNGDYIEALSSLGFGFIEIGTVTPKPQLGNPKPRLFRLAKEKALINRMGFNNKGMDYLASKLEKTNYRGILGINIGKNKDTPNEKAIDDYLACFRKLWKYASYITINISSPNTPGLRDLQHIDALRALLSALKNEQQQLSSQKYVPLVVKISPDLTETTLAEMATIFLELKIDGVIATNTTISSFNEAGGVSGTPLIEKSQLILDRLHQLCGTNLAIISSGGIMNNQIIQQRLQSGACLVQIYTGLIYEGCFFK